MSSPGQETKGRGKNGDRHLAAAVGDGSRRSTRSEPVPCVAENGDRHLAAAVGDGSRGAVRSEPVPLGAILAVVVAAVMACAASAGEPAKPAVVREIFVPFESLNVVLDNQPRRVMLSRKEYDALVEKAKKAPEIHAPASFVLVSADYSATVEKERAVFKGTLVVDVLEDGLHAVPLELSGVGLRSAALDGKPAALGQADDGRVTLFVEGKGSHTLALEMVMPLATTAAEQVLRYRLPRPAAARLHLTVPGDVEIKSGADVASRVVDEAARVTRFELVPKPGDTDLVMTLNSHLARRQRAVVARSVLVAEVTEAYQRLHATVSMRVLHQAVDSFRFVVPEGFEVTEVSSPLLARWAIAAEDERRILEVKLREQTTDLVVLNLSAVRTAVDKDQWTLPRLEPLDVVGQAAVVGLLVDQRLKAEAIAAEGLIPIDTAVLRQAIPETVFRAEPGAPAIRPVVAYYAPQAEFRLSARFVRPPAETAVRTDLALRVEEKGLEARGGFLLAPQVEKLFGFDFSVPPGWQITAVTGADGKPLAFERYGEADQAGRIHVDLPSGVAPGQQYQVRFLATNTPAGWLAGGQSRIEVPVFAVAGASEDVGAIAVDARDDITVRPETLDRLVPLDEAEKAQYGLSGVSSALVYRYDGQPYQATLAVQRTRPRLTARTYSFLRVLPDALDVHYEIVYQVEEARTQQVAIRLPADTPGALSIRAMDDVQVKEFGSEAAGAMRRWKVLLVEPRRDKIRLAVDFQQPLGREESKGLALPLVVADGVAYQSGLVSVEGSPELEVRVATKARRVDVGELVDADYQPGRNLLGAYGFVGDPPEVKIDVLRHPGYRLPPAIVEKAELTTFVSTAGISQTAAQFNLRTKALFLEVRLPPQAELWSADLDGQPIKPQRDKKSLLASLPAGTVDATRSLRIVYQAPVNRVALSGSLDMPAPELWLRADRGAAAVEVPLADLVWHLQLPTGYEVIRSDGTVFTPLPSPEPAILTAAKTGVGLLFAPGPLLLPAMQSARESARSASSFNSLRQLGAALDTATAPEPDAPAATPGELAESEEAMPAEEMPAAEQPVFDANQAPAADPFAPPPVMEPKSEAAATPPPPFINRVVPSTAPPMSGRPGAPARPETASRTAESVNGQVARDGTELDALRSDLSVTIDEVESLARELQSVPGGTRGPGAKEPLGERLEEARERLGRIVIDAEKRGGLSAEDKARVNHLDVTFGMLAETDREGMPSPYYAADDVQYTEYGRATRPATPPAKRALGISKLEGFSSLKIDLEQNTDNDMGPISFQSLGESPRLEVTIVNRPRLDTLAWGIALAVALVGLWLTGRPAGVKIRFLLAVVVLGTLLPLVPGLDALLVPANYAVYAACLLVPYYLLAAAVGSVVRSIRARRTTARAGAAAAVALAMAIGLIPSTGAAEPPKEGPYVIQVVEPSEPVKVPADAIILPYDPESKTGIQGVDQLLVPYARYVELWNRAYPDKKLETPPPPALFGLAGASYRTRLAGEDYLVVEGQLEIDVFTDEYVSFPLGLQGGVLAKADLDGKPARLSVPAVQPVAQQAEQPAQQQAAAQSGPVPPRESFLVLHVSGKGRHRLDLAVRLRLERRGGWRVAEGRLPSAPASALTITVPEAKTEVRLGRVLDRASYETEQADEQIPTALGPDGSLSLQWRPKVAEAQVDRSLTVRSAAVLDVQEDGLRVAWQLGLEFPRSQRDTFTLRVPKGYLVEKVEGGNVRGWETREAADVQSVEVTLLNTAKDGERLTVLLRQSGAVGQAELSEFDVPLVTVPDAALHNGELTIRRSPLLDVRAVSASGVTRTDLGAGAADRQASALAEESPLELRPYQAYRFVSVPFAIRLAASPVGGRVTADVQTTLQIAEYERSLRSRILLSVEDRPIYAIRVLLPEELKLEDVTAPGEFQWALTRQDNRPLLSVYLGTGQQGQVALLLGGSMGRKQASQPQALPVLEVLDVQRQQGSMAVLVDPAYDVQAKELVDVESVLLSRVHAWLNPEQQRFARLALQYRAPTYRGVLQLNARKPIVTCDTITNVRVTDRAVEETILLDFRIEQAGIRRVEFLLPAWMKEARINVRELRQKTIEPVAEKVGSPIRVRLDLQDEVMDEFRVLVVNDRLLTAQSQPAPIPVVATGRTDRQFVALESAGRDEVVVERSDGLERLTRQQREWGKLTSILGGNITQAYLVAGEAKNPRLIFRTHERTAVETSGARIGLAETNLVMDRSGAYRAEQTYRLSNTTEQYLEIQLPPDAELWTARVAGQAVKPTQVPGAKQPGRVRIPLVKTEAGDLDYPVVLKYGGRLPPLGSVGSVDFPLVRTVNINVDLSQVRLYLPESHQWFDFGGTMGLVEEEAEMAAGYRSYETKVAERLLKTMRTGDDFAKVRAANSAKNLRQQRPVELFDSTRSMSSMSGRLQQELQRNEEALQQVQQQAEQLESQPAEESWGDNRARLNDRYLGQKTSRAKNVVQQVEGGEGQVSMPTGQEQAGKGFKLNTKWLEGNKLLNPMDSSKPQEAAQRLQETYNAPVQQWKKGKAAIPPPSQPVPAQTPVNGDYFDFSAPQQPQGTPQDQMQRRMDDKRDRLNRYQQEHLQKQQAEQQVLEDVQQQMQVDLGLQQGQSSMGFGRAGGQAEVSVGGRVQTGMAGGFHAAPGGAGGMGGMGQMPGDLAAAAQPQPPQAAGLASLDVQLPWRGTVYRFSTPQGDVAITARAASNELTTGAARTAAVVLLVVLIAGAAALVRRSNLSLPASRIGGAALILVALLLFCVFPVPGLLALLAGVVILARRR